MERTLSGGLLKAKAEILNKGFKFRLYPNKTQRELIAKTFGCTRFIYNKMLSDKKEHYEKTGKCSKILLPSIKMNTNG